MSEAKVVLPDLNPEKIMEIASLVLSEPIKGITDWTYEGMSDGTVGAVFAVKGRALCHSGEVQPWSAVLKVQKHWARLGDPLSWRRELLMYQSDIFDLLADGLSVPRCYLWEDRGDETWLWLEHLSGKHGADMSVEDYSQVAYQIGLFQGSVARRLPADPWLSSRYTLVHYAADWGTDALSRMQSDTEESGNTLPSELTREISELWAERDQLLDRLWTLPRTIVHRDLTPGNIFVSGHRTAVLDWDCAGIGVVGEDMADLLAEALVYYDFDVSQASALHDSILAGYLSGLEAAGWQGEKADVSAAMAIHLALHWCPRTVCYVYEPRSPMTQTRYVHSLRYFLQVVRATLRFSH